MHAALAEAERHQVVQRSRTDMIRAYADTQSNAGGTIQRCDPPKSFAAAWEYGGEVSWIEVYLSAEPVAGSALEATFVVGVEALVRWRCWARGLIPPDELPRPGGC